MSFLNNSNFDPVRSKQELINKSKNSVISNSEKLSEDSDKSLLVVDEFAELPDFCRHFPNEWKSALVSLNKLHHTPYEFGAAALLGYSNMATMHLYNVDSGIYGVKPIVLFIMILLGTGGTKSTVHNELMEPFNKFMEHMQQALIGEDARFVREEKKYKKDIKKWEEEYELGNIYPAPKKPVPAETARYVQEKFTVNALIDRLVCQPHTSIVSAEAGKFFSGHAFQAAQKNDDTRSLEMTTTLTSLWDGSSIGRAIKDEYVELHNRRANVMFMIQAYIVRDVLNNKSFQNQGFIPRLLICDVPNFNRPLMLVTPEAEAQRAKIRLGLDPYLNRLRQLLQTRPRFMVGPDHHYELDPIVLKLDYDAKQCLADFYNENLTIGHENGRLERFEGFANRLHEHALRIAATLAAFRAHDTVKLIDAQAAVDLMNLFIDHRCKLDLGGMDTNPELTHNKDMLLTWFKKHSNKEFTKIEIKRSSPLRKLNMNDIVEVLTDLLNGEEIVPVHDKAPNGREVVRYKIAK